MTTVVFSPSDDTRFAHMIGFQLDAIFGQSTVRSFPDGESYVRLETDVKDRPVILVCTLDRPDSKLLPLIFMAATAKQLGASSVGLVSPYLPYMRQDRRFKPGESITSVHFASIVSKWMDWLVTIDPHLHRRSSLSEIYSIPTKSLHAAPLLAKWIEGNIPRPLIVGPDSESEQWVSAVASQANAPHLVLKKIRRGDRDVEVSVPDFSQWADHTPVLVDDIVSTARTMIETTTHILGAGLKPPVCIGTHGIFAGEAIEELERAGVNRVVTSNTIPHPTNAIDVSGLIAHEIIRWQPFQ